MRFEQEHVAEKVVVPVPLAIVVKRHHKQVAQVQVAQEFAAPLGLHDGVTEP